MFYVCMRLNAVSIAINPEIYKNMLEGINFSVHEFLREDLLYWKKKILLALITCQPPLL